MQLSTLCVPRSRTTWLKVIPLLLLLVLPHLSLETTLIIRKRVRIRRPKLNYSQLTPVPSKPFQDLNSTHIRVPLVAQHATHSRQIAKIRRKFVETRRKFVEINGNFQESHITTHIRVSHTWYIRGTRGTSGFTSHHTLNKPHHTAH